MAIMFDANVAEEPSLRLLGSDTCDPPCGLTACFAARTEHLRQGGIRKVGWTSAFGAGEHKWSARPCSGLPARNTCDKEEAQPNESSHVEYGC